MAVGITYVLASEDASQLVKVLSCCEDHRPKTGTEYRGLINTGRGLPVVYVSEESLAAGTRHRLHDTHWSTIEGHADVLRLNKTEPL